MAGFLIPYTCFAVFAYSVIAVCMGEGGRDEPDSRFLSRIVASLIVALVLYVVFGGCHRTAEKEPEPESQEEILWGED